MSRLRRFVAGAICPACGLMDKLFLDDTDDARVRECVACGFSERLDRAGTPDPEVRKGDAETTQPVRILER